MDPVPLDVGGALFADQDPLENILVDTVLDNLDGGLFVYLHPCLLIGVDIILLNFGVVEEHGAVHPVVDIGDYLIAFDDGLSHHVFYCLDQDPITFILFNIIVVDAGVGGHYFDAVDVETDSVFTDCATVGGADLDTWSSVGLDFAVADAWAFGDAIDLHSEDTIVGDFNFEEGHNVLFGQEKEHTPRTEI